MPSELKVHDFDQLGAAGLNTQEASVSLPGPFASVAQNAVFDAEGILRPRPVFARYETEAAIGATIVSMHKYLYTDGAGVNWPFEWYTDTGGIFNDAGGPVAGVYTVNGDEKYTSVRLGDKVYFFSRGSLPKVSSLPALSGAVNDIADATAPTGHLALAAFGRLWTADTDKGNDDKRTLYWSVLLDGEDFSGVGSGSLDMTSIWGTSDDVITALAEFNNFLVVFGLKRIVILANPFIPSIAADGTQTAGDAMYVQDQILGIGAISRDAVTNTGEDVVFMDIGGLFSLQRVIQEKSNPISAVCPQVQDLFKATALFARTLYLQTPQGTQLKLVYHPTNDYLLLCTGTSTNYCIHMNRIIPQVGPAVTTWSGLLLEDVLLYTDVYGRQDIYAFGEDSSSGAGVKNAGFFYEFYGLNQPSYDTAETFTFSVATTWEVLKAPSVTKMLKKAFFTYQGTAATLVTFKAKFNFQDSTEQTFTFVPNSGSGYRLSTLPIGGNGETVLLTVSYPVTVALSTFRINRLSLQYKQGRINSGV